ncbi:MAG: hypothetical protein JWN66_2989 [Sphingomonas bacterium]|uniref:hypothetical protein n=1 Tax=Sphingomonas bacterium TaxID=1895847 RepID=UPI002614A06E|nr:hypothetical protein [Sphingomonas bacterium]MDB5705873.1 hypothetical protein [Sphingomonas bacterium]
MVESPRRQRLSLPVAPLIAAVLGGLIALVFALIPAGILEDFVIDSGIAAVVPAAEPPLGFTARAVLILIAGGGTALVAWFGLFLLIGGRSLVVQRSGEAEDDEKAPVLRRADAHPDAPSRRPLSANRELGTPFLEVRAERPVHARAEEPEIPEIEAPRLEPVMERDLPADLDTPLAAFDPRAIPDEPADWFPPPAPLLQKPRQQVFDPGERFETFELTPMVREAAPVRAPEPVAAIEPALLHEPVALREPAPLREPVAPHEPAPLREPMPLPEPVAMRDPAPVREPWPIAAPTPPLAAEPWPIGAPTPPVEPARPRRSARVEVDPSASIHALLDRLERGVGMRETVAPPPPPPPREESLQEALVTLRRLATRG